MQQPWVYGFYCLQKKICCIYSTTKAQLLVGLIFHDALKEVDMTKQHGSFCGFSLDDVRILGLHPELIEIESGVYKLALCDKKGPKWEIRPITFQENTRIPVSISLYHRNKGNAKMHYQKVYRSATKGGIQGILNYIANHERYERTGIRN
jgi:hypothetical protein